jgi:hypothetical protein
MPIPFDEEFALRYIHHGMPAWDSALSKAFVKLVPKYTDTNDWLYWCKSVQRFTSSGFSDVSGQIRWRLALRHLPTKYHDVILHSVMSPGFHGLTWRGFLDLIHKHVWHLSPVLRAQKAVRGFSAKQNESVRNFLI